MAQFRWNILKVIGLAALFGFVSGILGGLIIASIYAPVYGIKEELSRVVPNRGATIRDNDKIDIAKSTLVTFYLNRAPRAIGAADRLGYGTLLTTDGWVITSAKVLRNGAASTLVITGDKKVYGIEKVFLDSATELAFIRLKGNDNFDAIGTSVARDLPFGSEILTIDAWNRVYRPIFTGISYINGEERQEQSSEKIRKFAFVTNTSQIDFLGGPLIDGSGKLIGVLLDPQSGRAAPIEHISVPFRALLRVGLLGRLSLGVTYVDLGGLVAPGANGDRGALISSLSGSGSRDFVVGDIILKVDGYELTSKLSLSQILADYEIGARVLFEIKHVNGNMETKEVVLQSIR